MLEDIKKALLAGLGGVVLTRDKIEEWKGRLVRENRMSEGDATRLIDDLIKAGEGEWKDLEGSLREMVKKTRQDEPGGSARTGKAAGQGGRLGTEACSAGEEHDPPRKDPLAVCCIMPAAPAK